MSRDPLSEKYCPNRNKNRKQIVVFLPSHFDRLLSEPYSSAASMQVDNWLDYCDREGLQSVRAVAK
ncbi:hypothetical protein H6F87_28970 [Cyanobacteria bacterium FACHB-502]|nr:hypothetical protein [Cyanobacteria bacterium FACHB-502]